MRTCKKEVAILPGLIKGFEQLGVQWKPFAYLYNQIFYAPMLEKEMKMVHVRKNDRIIHIGCGALPLTALYLGKQGFSVLAVDRDKKALEKAQELVRRSGMENRIQFLLHDGKEMDYSPYDIIWISLHATPREAIQKQAFHTMKEGARVICRNSRGWLKTLYPGITSPEPQGYRVTKKRQRLGKETLVWEKRTHGVFSLEEMAPGMEGRITALPENPLLFPLGLRPNKVITMEVRQPFHGPIVAVVEGRKIALGEDLAQKIQVECVS